MREYSVKGTSITVAGASTLVAINPAAGQTIEIVRAWCSQNANATSAQVAIEMGLKATAFSTLTGAAPQKIKSSDPVSLIVSGTAGAAGTAGINASAEGGGATTLLYPDNFNALQGWLWSPNFALGETYMVNSAAAQAFYLKFSAAPATLNGWSFGVTYREIG